MNALSGRPRVYVIGTGGSISFLGASRTDFTNYVDSGQSLTIDEMLGRIPEVHDFADVRTEQLLNVPSFDLLPAHWVLLAKRINKILGDDSEAAGVAIAHGTGTLEETAYFLNLTVRSEKPIVVTGAMRPPTALDSDANLNLMDCIRVAANPRAAGKGVLTVLNNEIHAARDVTKIDSHRLGNFKSNELGCLGYCDSDQEVVFYRTPTHAHTLNSEFDIDQVGDLPRVEIAYVYAGIDGAGLRALTDAGTAGVVVAAIGSGRAPSAFMEALREIQRLGVKVVIATQTGNGRVSLTDSLRRDGFIVADNLAPKKARILLMLALSQTHDAAEIQRMMWTY